LAKREHSLAGRLLLIALIAASILLVSAAYLLCELNKRGVERAFDRRLQVYVRLLVTDLTNNIEENENSVGNILSEPLFEVPQSGWYWQITRVSDKEDLEPLASRSMLDWQFPLQEGNLIEGYQTGPENQQLRYVEREIDLSRLGKFRVIVSGNVEDIDESIRPFNLAIYAVFSLLWLSITLGAFMQVRYGLSPLRLLTARLALIRNGKAERLEGDFPREISPLTTELNALIETNKDIVDRARTHVGNLAHALKTPLSVLKNEAVSDAVCGVLVREQTEIMQRQVHVHLERAKVAARAQYSANIVDISALMTSLLKTMERVHRGKDLDSDIEMGIKWRGEAEDFLELAGNITDNAFKWATLSVLVSLKTLDDQIILTLEDDGKGVTDEQLLQIGKRGMRLDETTKGSGLGLSIAADLAKLYRGAMVLDHSEMGGLKVKVTLQNMQ
jgi:signal transduction histidine kinase